MTLALAPTERRPPTLLWTRGGVHAHVAPYFSEKSGNYGKRLHVQDPRSGAKRGWPSSLQGLRSIRRDDSILQAVTCWFLSRGLQPNEPGSGPM